MQQCSRSSRYGKWEATYDVMYRLTTVSVTCDVTTNAVARLFKVNQRNDEVLPSILSFSLPPSLYLCHPSCLI